MLIALKKGVFGPGRYAYGALVFERLNGGQSNTVREVTDEAVLERLLNTGHFEVRSAGAKKTPAPPAPPARVERPAPIRTRASEAFPVDLPEEIETIEAHGASKPVAFPIDEPAQPTPAEAGNPIPPRANLEEMTFGELVGYAKSRGIKLTRDMKKAAVVNAILGSK